MRQSDKTTRTLVIALLAVLCSGGAPVTAGDGPDTLPTTGLAADLPPIATPPAEALAEDSAQPLATEWASPDTAEALLVTAQVDPAALGPLSIGTPDSGLLLNPVPFSPGPLWTVRDPSEAWGTEETIDFVVTAIEAVESRYPGSPRLVIGDLSNPRGGRLNRHKSHQAGRDVDIGFYFQRGEAGLVPGRCGRGTSTCRAPGPSSARSSRRPTSSASSWTARSSRCCTSTRSPRRGRTARWLNDVFGRTSEKGIIQHERRHKDHLHVRFYNPVAQEHGRIVYPVLVETGAAPPPMVKHRVRPGETLGSLARRYGTSASSIRAANGLRSSRLRAGRSYTIPIRRTPPDTGPVVVPPRRLPPEMQASSVAAAPADTAGADAPAAEER